MQAPKFYEYKTEIISKEEPTQDHFIIRFKLLEPRTIDFVPGQFVQTMIEGIIKPASFSIASSPEDKEEIELAFKKIGQVTGALANMQLGDKTTLRAPLGRFTYTKEDGDVVALAGGVGITPFICALRYLRDQKLPNKYTLFYSSKKKPGLLYFNELENMSKTHENLNVVFTTTDEQQENWPYETRRIDADMIKEHVLDYKTRTYYICGSKEFIDAMIDNITSLGVDQKQIRREIW